MNRVNIDKNKGPNTSGPNNKSNDRPRSNDRSKSNDRPRSNNRPQHNRRFVKKIEKPLNIEDIPLNMDRKSLYFLPLGGAGEFGLNLNLYHCNGKWILVDLGMSFEDLPGTNITLPDIKFIQQLDKKDVLGLVITHGHEDHIGAIPYLIEKLNIPVYADLSHLL